MSTFDLIYFGSLIVAVILHEISHGVMALAYGDDTAKRAGRLTVNPIPHIDPLGSLILPAMAVLANLPVLGWARPVPVNPNQLRNPRRQMLYVGLVGPATNFALMLGAAAGARALFEPASLAFLPPGGIGLERFLETQPLAFDILFLFALVNMFLGVFNLLPIPPLDGSSLIERVIPPRHLQTWWKIRPYGILILFLLLFYADVLVTIIRPFQEVLTEFVVA